MDRTNEIDAMASVTEQASAWWLLLSEGDASAAERRAFAEWSTRSPERVGAFLQAARLTQVLGSPGTQWPDTSVEELVRAAQASRNEVTRLAPAQSNSRAGESSGSRRFEASDARRHEGKDAGRAASSGWGVSLAGRLVAGAAVAIAAAAIGLHFSSRPERIETAIGEQRSVQLSDGSLVTLNTASVVELRFSRDRRQLTLLAGEALFKVAHDAGRPFDVIAGSTTVRAIGTRFNVDRRENATTVTVVEGRVAVFAASAASPESAGDSVSLGAGERVTRTVQGAGQVARADVGTSIAWTERKLIFERRPLGEVASEFNRYNRQVIEIQGERLRGQEVTGVFQAGDPESFLMFLSRLPDVTVERTPDSRVIVRSREAEGVSR